MTQEALKLALEALEDNFDIWTAKTKAITALREALAQPPVAKPHEQDPVACEPNDAELLKAFTRSNNGPNPFYRCNTCGDTEPGVREYLSNHWLKHNNTSPPQRKPLTDEEIMELLMPVRIFGDGYYLRIARAIEAAHGIKENT